MEAELPSGTVTLLLTEGKRMMRLSRELTPDLFEALLSEYRSESSDAKDRLTSTARRDGLPLRIKLEATAS
jgi:hypothetical protein